MFLRIYYNGKVNDVSLNDRNEFLIGSNTNGGFDIPNSDLKDIHVKFVNSDNKWKAVCLGIAYLMGNTVIEETELSPSLFMILSRENKISVLVVEDYTSPSIVELDNVSEIKIGRLSDNNIVLGCALVSGHHAAIKIDNGNTEICDCNSTNGTYINENLIKSSSIGNNDVLYIGDCKFTIKNRELYLYGSVKSINLPSKVNSIDGKLIFKRSPRIMLKIPSGEIVVQAPKILVPNQT